MALREVIVNQNKPANSSVTSVAASATAVTLLAANTNRLVASFFNDSTSTLFLKLGSGASSTSYTTQVLTNGYFELVYPAYTGIITGIWTVATGNARITELTQDASF